MLKSKEFLLQEELLQWVNDTDNVKNIVSIATEDHRNYTVFILFYNECYHEWVLKNEVKQNLVSGDSVDVGPYYKCCAKCGALPENDK